MTEKGNRSKLRRQKNCRFLWYVNYVFVCACVDGLDDFLMWSVWVCRLSRCTEIKFVFIEMFPSTCTYCKYILKHTITSQNISIKICIKKVIKCPKGVPLQLWGSLVAFLVILQLTALQSFDRIKSVFGWRLEIHRRVVRCLAIKISEIIPVMIICSKDICVAFKLTKLLFTFACMFLCFDNAW